MVFVFVTGRVSTNPRMVAVLLLIALWQVPFDVDETGSPTQIVKSMVIGLLRSNLDDWITKKGLKDEIDDETYAFLARVRVHALLVFVLPVLTIYFKLFVKRPEHRPSLADVMDDPFWGAM